MNNNNNNFIKTARTTSEQSHNIHLANEELFVCYLFLKNPFMFW